MRKAVELTEIRIKGANRQVPSLEIDGRKVVVLGQWLRVASVHDEIWTEGQVASDPPSIINAMKEAGLKADVFTFRQKLPNTEPRYRYHLFHENWAVIRTGNLETWWERLPQSSRKNVRRAARRGVVVRETPCDEALIEGITEIYNELPIRDGRPYPHYGKDVATVRREVRTLLDRSRFLGAYFGTELIGVLKLVYMGKVASVLYLACKQAHFDKRAANALLAAAAEGCHKQGVDYLVYDHFNYGSRTNSPLTEFKRRNGFEPILVPRYFVPMTVWGDVSLKLRLYRGVRGLLPTWIVDPLLKLRSQYYEKRLAKFMANRNTSLDARAASDDD